MFLIFELVFLIFELFFLIVHTNVYNKIITMKVCYITVSSSQISYKLNNIVVITIFKES